MCQATTQANCRRERKTASSSMRPRIVAESVSPRVTWGGKSPGGLDLPATLQPQGYCPADERPGRAQRPACHHVRRPVNTEINAAHADQNSEEESDQNE